ncbi:MAG: pyridoxamine 5'-phosphate oxidase family protein [Anaerolineae bacterium]|nr:pyridoxamine 5'-phosphate oxidase family protein [Anaerolineae bacterium]
MMNNAIPDEKKAFIDSFLENAHIARVATSDSSGQPHVVPVWYAWDGESLWISSYSNTRKIKDLENNPKMAVSIDIAEEGGKTQAVIFEGTADLVRDPRDFLRQQFYWIYKRYLGDEGVKAPGPQEWIEDPHNLLIKLTPQQVYTWNW